MAPKNLKTWAPQPQNVKQGLYSIEAPGYKRVDGETIPRINAKAKDGLLKTLDNGNIQTSWDIVPWASKKYGNAKAMANRTLVKMHNETKKIKKMVDGKEQEVDKKWQYYELSEYKYMTFTEYEQLARNIGAGFRKLGLEAGDRVQLFAATSPRWLATAHGAGSQSIPIVTAYDTLGEEGLAHSMTQTGVKAIYLDALLLGKLVGPLKKTTELKHIIYNVPSQNEGPKSEDLEKLKSEHPGVTVQSFDELVELGKQNPVDVVPPKADDLCCIMYTSGSTGAPKGCLLKHKNVVAAIAGVDAIISPYLGPGDSLLAYLPLAHIFEYVFENATIFWGGTLGYGNPKTLSDTSVRNCKGDIREFKPTILIGVPAVWESVKKGIVGKVAAGGAITKNLFWGAFYAKQALLGWHLPGTGILDSIVFSKIRDATGGKLRLCLNGGGPVSKETQNFISMAITPMISGYGLTETCAMGALMDPLSWNLESLGEIPASIEMKLVDFPDAGYHATNNPPQGEIWIRGDAITSGYLDLEKETQEAFTNDGWFKTGDIGEWSPRGEIRIIDRKKNLVKTLNGEYIALEKLESIYRSATVVANICVYADPNEAKPIAIIVPAEPALKKLAQENGVKGDSLEELVHQEKIVNAVTKQLQAQGKQGGLAGIEIVEGVALADEEWTPQNGLTTSAQKLNRKAILDKYKKEVDAAYKRAG